MAEENAAVFVFRENPVGKVYQEVIDYCCAHAHAVLLVIREPDGTPCSELREAMARLSPYASSVVRSNKWPGTILYDGDAELHEFRIEAGLAEVLKSMQNGLFEWVHPSAPEDLIFLRESGDPVLVTISHERDAYMILAGREREVIADQYPGLSAVLVEEGP